MSLSHYDPLASLRAVESAFTRLLTEPQTNRPWAPSVDIYETENELVVKADLPDVEAKDIDVRVENQTLTIADRKSTRLNSSHRCISYAVFCLKKHRTSRTHPGISAPPCTTCRAIPEGRHA